MGCERHLQNLRSELPGKKDLKMQYMTQKNDTDN